MIQPFVILSFMINLLFTVFTAFVIYTNAHKQKRFILSMAHNIKVCSNHVESSSFPKSKMPENTRKPIQTSTNGFGMLQKKFCKRCNASHITKKN